MCVLYVCQCVTNLSIAPSTGVYYVVFWHLCLLLPLSYGLVIFINSVCKAKLANGKSWPGPLLIGIIDYCLNILFKPFNHKYTTY